MNSGKDKQVGRFDVWVNVRESNLVNIAERWRKGKGKGRKDMMMLQYS